MGSYPSGRFLPESIGPGIIRGAAHAEECSLIKSGRVHGMARWVATALERYAEK